MSDVIETIKHSKVLVVLLILYTIIAIGVVIIDKTTGDKKQETDPKADVKSEENKKKFSVALSELYEDIDMYVEENESEANTCILLSDIYPDEDDIQGSVLVSNRNGYYNVWYTQYGLYLNGSILNGWSIDSDEFGTSFESAYFNNCGKE